MHKNTSRRYTLWFLLALGCCVAGCFPQCAKDTGSSKQSDKPTVRRVVKEVSPIDQARQLGQKLAVPSTWLKKTWMVQIIDRPKSIPQFFGADAARRKDIAALWENRWPDALAETVDFKSLSPSHSIVRGRIHLHVSTFYREAYILASSLNLGRLKKRKERSKKLSIGRLFSYYYGRQLCMSGFRKQAVVALKKALSTVPKNRKSRVQAWLLACEKKASDASSELSTLSFADDADGETERLIIQLFFGLKSSALKARSERAQMWTHIAQSKLHIKDSKWLRGFVDSEEIQSKVANIKATLRYFDPAVLKILSIQHAHMGIKWFQKAPKKDAYRTFFLGKLYHLIGARKQAQAAYKTFIATPPTQMNWAYMLFSSWWSLDELRADAIYSLAMLQAVTDKQAAWKALKTLQALSFPAKVLGYVGALQLLKSSKGKQRTHSWVQVIAGTLYAKKIVDKLFVLFTKAAQATAPKGSNEAVKNQILARSRAANAVIRWRLHRFAAKRLVTWSSQGALKMGQASLAERWLEQLHRKDNPYAIGGANSATQFIRTANAYIRAGKMGIATLYLSKSKKTFPALTQIWSLLRILRIYRGTDGSSVIVPPKSG